MAKDHKRRNRRGGSRSRILPDDEEDTDLDNGHVNSAYEMDSIAEEKRNNRDRSSAGQAERSIVEKFQKTARKSVSKKNAINLISNIKSGLSKWRNYATGRRSANKESGVSENYDRRRTGGGLASELGDIGGKDNTDGHATSSTHKSEMVIAHNRNLIEYFARMGQSKEADASINLEYVASLLKNGANINCTDKYGQSVFHEVARAWHTDVAQFLIEQNADINHVDNYGRTPLHVSAAVDYPEMVTFLINNGANKEARTKGEHQTPVYFAARNDACLSLKALLKQHCEYKDVRDYKGRTPLHVAAELDRSETARMLLELDDPAPAGVEDDSGQAAIVWMITKMPPVAKLALDQFHTMDRANRKQYFHLHKLEPRKPDEVQHENHPQTALQVTVAYRRLDLIIHPALSQLIKKKWVKFGRVGACLSFALNLLFIVSWSILGILVEYDRRYLYILPSEWWRILLFLIAIGLTVWQLKDELTEFYVSRKNYQKWRQWREEEIQKDIKMTHPRWKEEEQYLTQEIEELDKIQPVYASDFWNIFDWICYAMLLVSIITHLVDIFHHTNFVARFHIRVMAVTIIIIWLRLLKNARAFAFLGPFIVMLTHMFVDCIRFCILYMEFYIPFACAFWMLYGGDKVPEEFQGLPDASNNTMIVEGMNTPDALLFTLFRLTLVDEYDYNGMKAVDPIMADLLLACWFVISAIFMLNLLIALLSDTFQRVYDNAQANAVMQKAITILGVEEGLSHKRREKFRTYIHTQCNPEMMFYDDDAVNIVGEDLKKVTIHNAQPYEQSLHIVNWNVNGWTDANSALRTEIINSISPDIICLSETHLDQNKSISVPNYKYYDNYRKLKHRKATFNHGGVGILVKHTIFNNFNIEEVDKSVDGILVIKMTEKNTGYTIVVFCCYLPPESSVWCNSTGFFCHLISTIYLCNDIDSIILGGDFNARISNLNDWIENIDDIPNRIPLDTGRKNKNGDAFIEFLKDTKLCIVNGRVTPEYDNFTCVKHMGSSVVDYIVVPHVNLNKCQECKVLLINDVIKELSLITPDCKPPDHSIVSLRYAVSYIPEHTYNENHQNDNCYKSKRYRLSSAPPNFQNNEIWNNSISEIIDTIKTMRCNQGELDAAYDEIVECMIKEMDKYVSHNNKIRKSFKYHEPYWDDELTQMWSDMHDNPRDFWKHIKSLGPKSARKLPDCVKIDNDELSYDKTTVLSKWRDDFKNLYNRTEEVNVNFDHEFYSSVMNDKLQAEQNIDVDVNIMLNKPISYDEVEYAIDKLKCNKATGIDNIPNEVLKHNSVKGLLFSLFNKCFHLGLVPSQWLKACIAPIPKGGNKDPYQPLSYRGISLLSTISKVYTTVLNNRLEHYLEEMSLIEEEQAGFRKSRACIDQAFILTSVIKNRLNENKDTFVAFVDFEKCFDWIDRDLMLYKLIASKVDGHFYRAIKSLYQESASCVRINDSYTDFFNVTSGVRQGDVLSPTIFNIMINDLAKEMKNMNLGVLCGNTLMSILMYAYDIALISDTPEHLQQMLIQMRQWCNKWRMKVNIDKTKVVHFRKKRKRVSKFVFKFGDDSIEIVSKYKYLGLFFDEHLDFNYGTDVLLDSGGRALGGIISKFKSLEDTGFKTFEKLFQSCVEAITEYFSGIWGFNSNKNVNKVFNRGIRYYLGLPPKAPIYGYQGDIGWLPPKYKHYTNMARLHNRLIHMDDSTLAKKVFLWDKEQGGRSWFKELQCVLDYVDMEYPNDGNSINLEMFKQKCITTNNEEWKSNLNSEPKLGTYKMFKESVETEKYISKDMSKPCRSIISQFRIGVLPLQNRLCKICNNNEIEDEYHFLCNCTAYDTQRVGMLSQIRTNDPGTPLDIGQDLFKYIIRHHQHIVGKYLLDAWTTRKDILYKNN